MVTLGVFDGVHLGHRAILAATRDLAAEQGMPSVALVFDPPPDEVLRPGNRVARLAPLAVNLERIEALGVTWPSRSASTSTCATSAAEAFLDALAPAIDDRRPGDVAAQRLRTRSGRDASPHAQQLGAERGFGVRLVEPVEVDGSAVSSTRIRAAIADGDVEEAQALGVAPYLEGIVVVGDRRGRELGFPTANLRFDYLPAMPSLGVYAGRVTQAGSGVTAGHPALISIGTRPTFHDDAAVLAEVHLLDFDGDLYGVLLGVELLARLRDEQRFRGRRRARRPDAARRRAGRAVLGMS